MVVEVLVEYHNKEFEDFTGTSKWNMLQLLVNNRFKEAANIKYTFINEYHKKDAYYRFNALGTDWIAVKIGKRHYTTDVNVPSLNSPTILERVITEITDGIKEATSWSIWPF